MNFSIEDYANEAPAASGIANIPDFLKPANDLNPIEDFRYNILEVIRDANPKTISSSSIIGRLLLVEIISATERYIRRALSRAIVICPLCHEQAIEKSVNLAGLLWHGLDRFALGAFENHSFTSSKVISSTFKEYARITLVDSVFKVPLENYDQICQFRHGVVHNAGYLPGKNAISLGVRRSSSPLRINVGFSQVQEVIGVSTVLVDSLNREIFSTLCRRWATEWTQRPDWDPENSERLFRIIWNDFHCKTDAVLRTGRSQLKVRKCMQDVLDRYTQI